jgi:hypothetical protein
VRHTHKENDLENPNVPNEAYQLLIGSCFRDPASFEKISDLYEYVKDVIMGRWPEAEPLIVKDPEYAYVYARDVIKGRWPEAEAMFLANSLSDWRYSLRARDYANDVIKGRWPEAESAWASYPSLALMYAKYVIKGRWPEIEPLMLADPTYAFQYAIEVIGGRWPEAEPVIMQYEYSAREYRSFLNWLERPWPGHNGGDSSRQEEEASRYK